MYSPLEYLSDSINGDKFANMCKYYWNDRGKQLDGVESESTVIFCKTDYLPEFFELIKKSSHKYVLVTHNSDYGIEKVGSLAILKTANFTFTQVKIPQNIVHWFGQNILTADSSLTPIPIGLERPGIAGSGNVDDLINNVAGIWTKNAIAYANFANDTNPTRPIIKDYLLTEALEWCSFSMGRIPFRHFLAEVRRHNFIIAPPGNGLDTHRMWEALYSGSIPVIENNPTNIFFAKILPVVLYTDIKEITAEKLQEEKIKIQRKLKGNEYTLQALSFKWWKVLINFRLEVG